MKICFGCFEQYDDSFDICPHCGYAEGTEPELATYMRPGAILNERYVIGRALGHGGFSVTYLAWDALLLHKVAIKEYLPSEYATRRPGESRLTIFSGKEGEYFQFGKEKFLDEAKRLSAFQNEDGIVHVYDCFSANETAYLVMEYLDGITLSEYLKKEAAVSPQGRIAPEEAISMLTPVMLSLQRVHDSGMIHRDIAPDNIMLLKDGGVRLIDFGAARHAVHDCGKSMTVIIKDGYSPEEQYNSHSVQGSRRRRLRAQRDALSDDHRHHAARRDRARRISAEAQARYAAASVQIQQGRYEDAGYGDPQRHGAAYAGPHAERRRAL